jgi:hypothetical protein
MEHIIIIVIIILIVFNLMKGAANEMDNQTQEQLQSVHIDTHC